MSERPVSKGKALAMTIRERAGSSIGGGIGVPAGEVLAEGIGADAGGSAVVSGALDAFTLDKWASTGYETASTKDLRALALDRGVEVVPANRKDLVACMEAWDRRNPIAFRGGRHRSVRLAPKSVRMSLPRSEAANRDKQQEEIIAPQKESRPPYVDFSIPLSSPMFVDDQGTLCGPALVHTTSKVIFSKWSWRFVALDSEKLRVYRARRAWELDFEPMQVVRLVGGANVSEVLAQDTTACRLEDGSAPRDPARVFHVAVFTGGSTMDDATSKVVVKFGGLEKADVMRWSLALRNVIKMASRGELTAPTGVSMAGLPPVAGSGGSADPWKNKGWTPKG